VVYQAPALPAPAEPQSRLLLDTVDVKEPAVWDLLSGESYKTGPAAVPGEKAKSLRVLVGDHPMAVVWERASENQPGLDVGAEDVRVATTRGLTAEEVIAKNRQVEKIQDDRLTRWIAKARADVHFKLAQGGARSKWHREHLLLAPRRAARMAANPLLRQRATGSRGRSSRSCR
jgi:hypothetical protein